VARQLSVGARPELADKRGMTALALACVKLGNLERLSGGAAAAADTAGGLAWPAVDQQDAGQRRGRTWDHRALHPAQEANYRLRQHGGVL
jgi:hypothetical protein